MIGFKHSCIQMNQVRFNYDELSLSHLDTNKTVSVTAQCAQLLCRLLLSANQVVEKAELVSLLWGKRVDTGQKGLNNLIWQLRKALSELEADVAIELVKTPVMGYKLIAEVNIEWDLVAHTATLILDPQQKRLGSLKGLLSLDNSQFELVDYIRQHQADGVLLSQLANQFTLPEYQLLCVLFDLQQALYRIDGHAQLLLQIKQGKLYCVQLHDATAQQTLNNTLDHTFDTNSVDDKQNLLSSTDDAAIGERFAGVDKKGENLAVINSKTTAVVANNVLFRFQAATAVLAVTVFGLLLMLSITPAEQNAQDDEQLVANQINQSVILYNTLSAYRIEPQALDPTRLPHLLDVIEQQFTLVNRLSIQSQQDLQLLLLMAQINIEINRYHQAELQLAKADFVLTQLEKTSVLAVQNKLLTKSLLIELHTENGDYTKAERVLASVGLVEQHPAPNSYQWLVIASSLGLQLRQSKSQLILDTVEKFENSLAYGQESQLVAEAKLKIRHLYGIALRGLGKLNAAIKVQEQALIQEKKLYGTGHIFTAERMNNIAVAYISLGKYRLGLDYIEQSIAIERQQRVASKRLALSLSVLSFVKYELDFKSAALTAIDEAIQLAKQEAREDNEVIGYLIYVKANHLFNMRQINESQLLLAQALDYTIPTNPVYARGHLLKAAIAMIEGDQATCASSAVVAAQKFKQFYPEGEKRWDRQASQLMLVNCRLLSAAVTKEQRSEVKSLFREAQRNIAATAGSDSYTLRKFNYLFSHLNDNEPLTVVSSD